MNSRWLLVPLVSVVAAEPFLQNFTTPFGANVFVLACLVALAFLGVCAPLAYSHTYRHSLWSFGRVVVADHPGQSALLMGFVSLLLMAFIRSALSETYPLMAMIYAGAKWILVCVVVIGAACHALEDGDANGILKGLLKALLLYVAINTLLWAAGFHNAVAESSYIAAPQEGVMLGGVGLHITRIPLAIGSGINSSGLQVGIAAAMGIAMLAGFAGGKRHAIALAGLGVLCVLLTDSRGAAAAALIAGGLALFSPGVVKRRLWWVALSAPFLPLVIAAAIFALKDAEIVQALSRSDDPDSGLLSGRLVIWAVIANHFLSFSPVQIIGYGVGGQIAAGLSPAYAAVFAKDYVNPATAGAHNVILQSLLDTGYLGVILLVALLTTVARRYALSLSLNPPAMVGLAGILYLLFGGMTGETVSFSTPVTLAVFLCLAVDSMVASSMSGALNANRRQTLQVVPATTAI